MTVSAGVTERPPLPDLHYAGFVVHPKQPGPITLAIAHKDGDNFVLDLIRDGLSIEQSAHLLKAYRIDHVNGADDEDDSSDSLAHAVAGVVSVLAEMPHG